MLGPARCSPASFPTCWCPAWPEPSRNREPQCVYIAEPDDAARGNPRFTLSDHVRAIRRNTGRRLIQWVVMNNQPIAPDVAGRYRSEGAEPVTADVAELRAMGIRCIFADLLEVQAVIRHDSKRLAHLLLTEFVAKSRGSSSSSQKT